MFEYTHWNLFSRKYNRLLLTIPTVIKVPPCLIQAHVCFARFLYLYQFIFKYKDFTRIFSILQFGKKLTMNRLDSHIIGTQRPTKSLGKYQQSLNCYKRQPKEKLLVFPALKCRNGQASPQINVISLFFLLQCVLNSQVLLSSNTMSFISYTAPKYSRGHDTKGSCS